jgi:hypothetical protein
MFKRSSPLAQLGLGFVACTSLLCICAKAQGASGVLSGTVAASQFAIPEARVKLRNGDTGVERAVTTGAAGVYTVPNLVPGTYEMTVEAPGFSTQVRTGLAVAVDAKLVINILMQKGDPKDVIRVALAAEQASSTENANVNASTVRDSPLNGRDWTQLAALEAGVTGIQTGGAAALRGFGAAISVSGARPDQNNYRLDGISINDYSNGAPGSVLGSNLGVDAVEQFSVLGSNYPAGYGRTSGGVINAVTRSGTNSFHGDVYEFLRNSALDARNFFDASIPPFKRNQFGASAGGPIQREHTFLFADYEGLRQSLGVTHVDTVPSPAARKGLIHVSVPGSPDPILKQVQVDPAVARFLNAFYPLANGPVLGNGDTAKFIFADQTVTTENYFTAKIDHTFSSRDNLSGTYLRDNSVQIQPDPMDELLSNVVSRRQLVTIREQHIFNPRLLNAVRFGFNRAVALEGGVSKVNNPRLMDPSFAFVPGEYVGWIQGVPGLTDFGGGLNPALPNTLSNSKRYTWNSFQGADDVVLTKGAHVLQFGAVMERMQDNLLSTLYVDGGFKFGSLEDLLSNRPRTFEGVVPRPVPVVGLRETLFGTYAQDDIRVRPGLNLSLGTRYEITTVPAEVNNRISNLDHLTDSAPRVGSPFFRNPTFRNFEPRAGLAWSPFQNSKTIVRSGFGIFDVLPLPYEFTLTIPNVTPFAAQIFAANLPPGTFPLGAFQQFSGSSTVSRASYTEPAPPRNYVMQWNINLERELAKGLSATVGYVGSHGVHEPYRQDNFDTVLPTLTAAGYLYPVLGSSKPLNPNFGRISGTIWQASSSYNALQAVVTKTVSHGIQLHAAYTFSKSIDTLSATVADDSFPNGLMNPLFFDQRTSRGLSDFDVRQNFVTNLTWETPVAKRGLRFTKWALSGWQLGGIYKASTGQPFTPVLGGDPLGTMLDETNEPPNRVVGPGCETLSNPGDPNHYIKTQCLAFPNPANLRGNLGRNTVIGPGLANLDFSLFKNNRIRSISESCSVQFRAEFFNVFNRANFASPVDSRTIFDQIGNSISSAGLITTTQTPARQIQFALKLIW